DQHLVDGAGQRGYDHVERRVVGDAQSGVGPLRNAEALQVRVDMLAAAVNEHDFVAIFPMDRDRAERFGAPHRIVEKASAQFDDVHQSSASVSAKPHMRLKFCTACDAAPLSRLSMTETITARRPPCRSWKPISARGVLTTFFSSGSCPAGSTRTNGAFAYARAYASAICCSVMACVKPMCIVDRIPR